VRFLFYFNNFDREDVKTLRQSHTVLSRAALSGPKRALDSARIGEGGVSLVKNDIVGIGQRLTRGPFRFEILEIDRSKVLKN